MATIYLHQTAIAKPEQFLTGLTDFGPDRSKIACRGRREGQTPR